MRRIAPGADSTTDTPGRITTTAQRVAAGGPSIQRCSMLSKSTVDPARYTTSAVAEAFASVDPQRFDAITSRRIVKPMSALVSL
jgi:hypothetical protein